ncbi:MAG TPA: capsule assembly Wzi family protein [Burkholderiaceae bacterium]
MGSRHLALSCALLGTLYGPVPSAVAAPAAALIDASELGLRDDLAWLADRGLINLGLGTWPLPRARVTSALDARRLGLWSSADLDALARVRNALSRLDEPLLLSWRVNTARHPVSDAGLAERARNQASIQVQPETDAAAAVRLRLGVQELPLASTPSQVTLDGSYAALSLPGAIVAIGALDRWWGPARYASPILGNAAPAVPALTLTRSDDAAPESTVLSWIGRWSYEISVGRPSHYQPSGPTTIGIRLSAQPLPGLELGLSRYIYFGGEGRPDSFGALRNALFANSNNDDPTDGEDPSNEIAGIDLRWAVPLASATWVGYAHFAGEDEANGSPSQWFGTVGLQLKHATENHRVEWTVEGTDTSPDHWFGLRSDNRSPAYRHGVYVAGHYHQGLPVGAFIGGGGTLGSLGVAWTPIDSPLALRYEARLWRANVSRQGSEPINVAYGQPGRVDGLSLQGAGMTRTLRWHLGLAVQRASGGTQPGRHDVGLIGGIEWVLREP